MNEQKVNEIQDKVFSLLMGSPYAKDEPEKLAQEITQAICQLSPEWNLWR